MINKSNMIIKSDIISCKNYKSICDYIYCPVDGYNIVPDGGVVWCTIDDILGFFEKIVGTGKSYIIVSSYSDFGLELQKDNSPNEDLIRTAKLASYQIPTLGYTGVHIPPVCNTERCRSSDKYSIKCYRYTNATFNEIPSEVKHWFLVNNMVDDERLTTIPFGIPEGKEDVLYDVIANVDASKPRDSKIYVNWSNNTLERVLFKKELKGKDGVFIEENTMEYADFIRRLCEYKYVICPPGNGYDSYRTLESIYCGCLPITHLDLPTISQSACFYDSKFYISSDDFGTSKIPNEALLSYWKNQVELKRKELLS